MLQCLTAHLRESLMQSVRDHYASHLAPIYVWMCGGVEAALTRGDGELDALGLVPRATRRAVDLGAASGGVFVLSFRDYTAPLEAERRFIPVKSDADRILTCFLEYEENHVIVHDLLHERYGSAWRQRVSAYRKLRLSPDWVVAALDRAGFQVRRQAGLSGMVRLVAQANPHG